MFPISICDITRSILIFLFLARFCLWCMFIFRQQKLSLQLSSFHSEPSPGSPLSFLSIVSSRQFRLFLSTASKLWHPLPITQFHSHSTFIGSCYYSTHFLIWKSVLGFSRKTEPVGDVYTCIYTYTVTPSHPPPHTHPMQVHSCGRILPQDQSNSQAHPYPI